MSEMNKTDELYAQHLAKAGQFVVAEESATSERKKECADADRLRFYVMQYCATTGNTGELVESLKDARTPELVLATCQKNATSLLHFSQFDEMAQPLNPDAAGRELAREEKIACSKKIREEMLKANKLSEIELTPDDERLLSKADRSDAENEQLANKGVVIFNPVQHKELDAKLGALIEARDKAVQFFQAGMPLPEEEQTKERLAYHTLAAAGAIADYREYIMSREAVPANERTELFFSVDIKKLGLGKCELLHSTLVHAVIEKSLDQQKIALADIGLTDMLFRTPELLSILNGGISVPCVSHFSDIYSVYDAFIKFALHNRIAEDQKAIEEKRQAFRTKIAKFPNILMNSPAKPLSATISRDNLHKKFTTLKKELLKRLYTALENMLTHFNETSAEELQKGYVATFGDDGGISAEKRWCNCVCGSYLDIIRAFCVQLLETMEAVIFKILSHYVQHRDRMWRSLASTPPPKSSISSDMQRVLDVNAGAILATQEAIVELRDGEPSFQKLVDKLQPFREEIVDEEINFVGPRVKHVISAIRVFRLLEECEREKPPK